MSTTPRVQHASVQGLAGCRLDADLKEARASVESLRHTNSYQAKKLAHLHLQHHVCAPPGSKDGSPRALKDLDQSVEQLRIQLMQQDDALVSCLSAMLYQKSEFQQQMRPLKAKLHGMQTEWAPWQEKHTRIETAAWCAHVNCSWSLSSTLCTSAHTSLTPAAAHTQCRP